MTYFDRWLRISEIEQENNELLRLLAKQEARMISVVKSLTVVEPKPAHIDGEI